MTYQKCTTSQRLKEAMELKRLKQADIVRLAQPFCEAHNLKLNKSDVSQFVSGKVTSPSQWKISILANVLDVNEAWLMGYDVPMERTIKTLVTEPEFEKSLIAKLTSLSDDQVRLIQSFLDLPPNQAQRVMDFLEGLKSAGKP